MKEMNQGLAKLQTLVKKIKKKNSLLIDTGDSIQGSPLQYYHQKSHGKTINPVAKVLNKMEYDYVTIGNHEFNYGLNYLREYLSNLKPTILNSNLIDSSESPITHKPYDIITFAGIKIGIIGVTTHYIPNWEQPAHIEGIEILDAFSTTKKYVDEIKDKVDFIIVNYHGGFERTFDTYELEVEDTGENQGSRMLKEIDGIDILLTGHQHRSLIGESSNVFYSQPGYNAQQVNEININFLITDEGISYQIEGKIHKLNDEEPDKKIIDLIQDIEKETQQYLDTPVGFLDEELIITNQLEARLNKHPLISLINHVQLEHTGADIALCGLGNDVAGFNKEISIRDILGTYIYPNTLVVKKLSGKDLRLALEKTAEFFEKKDNKIVISEKYAKPKLQLYAYDMYDGINYTINTSNVKGKRIENLRFNGKEVTDNMSFSVAMNNYRSAGGGDYTFIKNCEVVLDTQEEIVNLLVKYISKHQHIKIDHKNNITIK